MSRGAAKKPAKSLWRQFVDAPLAFHVTCVVVAAVAAAVLAIGYYAAEMLVAQKTRDLRAIVYQTMAQYAQDVGAMAAKTVDGPPAGELTRNKGKRFKGALANGQPVTVTLDAEVLGGDLALVKSGIGTFLVSLSEGKKAKVWRFDVERLLRAVGRDMTVFVLTRQGRLIYSNSAEIANVSAVKRPIVQSYINAPFRSGQMEYDGLGHGTVAFYSEVTGTDAVIFGEMRAETLWSRIQAILVRAAIVIIGVTVIAILFAHLSVTRLMSPLNALQLQSHLIGLGQFRQPLLSARGELMGLSHAFHSMGQQLQMRNDRIHQLMIETEEKGRLRAELELASNFQKSMVKTFPVPPEARVNLGARYRPASELAGDWYTWHYDEATQTTTVAIVDVSGHGAGSAMLTAMIAGIFYQMHAVVAESPGSFFDAVHRALRDFAPDEAHATGIVAVCHAPSNTLRLSAAGHPWPVALRSGVDEYKRVKMPASSPAGMSGHVTFVDMTIDFPANSSFVMFTDGLYERGSLGTADIKPREIVAALADARHTPLDTRLDKLLALHDQYLNGRSAADDVCIVGIERSA